MKCRLTLRSQRKARCKARCLSLAAAAPVEIVLDLPWNLGPSMTFPILTFGSCWHMGVSENRLNPIVPNGFADPYPYEKWLFHWEYTQHFQTNPYPATANPWICNTNFTAWRQGNAKLTVWRSQALVPQPLCRSPRGHRKRQPHKAIWSLTICGSNMKQYKATRVTRVLCHHWRVLVLVTHQFYCVGRRDSQKRKSDLTRERMVQIQLLHIDPNSRPWSPSCFHWDEIPTSAAPKASRVSRHLPPADQFLPRIFSHAANVLDLSLRSKQR